MSTIFLWQGIYLPKSFVSGREKIFLIEQGQSFLEISENLEKEGLIQNRIPCIIYLFLTGKYKQLQAGRYSLSSVMAVPEMVEKIISGKIAEIKITIPEGFTLKQIEDRLIEKQLPVNGGITNRKITLYKEGFDFLTGLSNKINLEGFLFPDTYYFAYEVTFDQILRKMLENFGEQIALYQSKITDSDFSLFEIITMASLIEKEVRTLEDKKLVSGILWKRLENNMPLQVDATITYITGKKTVKVTLEDLKIDSPYNTYKYKGLPAGPICNPGLESIQAALYLEESEYWFYLSTPEGETIFSKTLEEHQIAKNKYLK